MHIVPERDRGLRDRNVIQPLASFLQTTLDDNSTALSACLLVQRIPIHTTEAELHTTFEQVRSFGHSSIATVGRLLSLKV